MGLNYTADQVMAGAAVLTLGGGAIVTVAGWLLHQKDEAQAVKMAAQAKDVERLLTSLEAAWKAIDRLKDERGIYSTREDQERWRQESKRDNEALRAELKLDLAELGRGLTRAIEMMGDKFSRQIEKFMEVKS